MVLAAILISSAVRELKNAPAKVGQAPVGLRAPEGRVLAESEAPRVMRFLPHKRAILFPFYHKRASRLPKPQASPPTSAVRVSPAV